MVVPRLIRDTTSLVYYLSTVFSAALVLAQMNNVALFGSGFQASILGRGLLAFTTYFPTLAAFNPLAVAFIAWCMISILGELNSNLTAKTHNTGTPLFTLFSRIISAPFRPFEILLSEYLRISPQTTSRTGMLKFAFDPISTGSKQLFYPITYTAGFEKASPVGITVYWTVALTSLLLLLLTIGGLIAGTPFASAGTLGKGIISAHDFFLLQLPFLGMFKPVELGIIAWLTMHLTTIISLPEAQKVFWPPYTQEQADNSFVFALKFLTSSALYIIGRPLFIIMDPIATLFHSVTGGSSPGPAGNNDDIDYSLSGYGDSAANLGSSTSDLLWSVPTYFGLVSSSSNPPPSGGPKPN